MSAPPRRIRIDLAYDGTRFAGWQVQSGQPTIQGALERALSRVCAGAPVRVRGAGRTDSGAHALGQVADAWVATRLDDARLLDALRHLLPADIRPRALTTMHPEFDAMRDAIAKTYRYRIDRSASMNPFQRAFALHERRPFDDRALQSALARLPGRRDWSAFAGSACTVRSRVRDLRAADYEERAGEIGVFSFAADGFLTHMVRNLVGTLLEVAIGRRDPATIDAALAANDRALSGPTAPAKGLVLQRVTYPGDPPAMSDPRGPFSLV